MQPKFDIGLAVKGINGDQEMIVINVLTQSDHLVSLNPQYTDFTGKYKCAWIQGHQVILKVCDESELIPA
jgi:uncharacterized protein YodC (DUF2158 family)